MSLELTLSDDLKAKVSRYPELPDIAVRFLEEQVALREWRERRYSEKARNLVAAVLEEEAVIAPTQDSDRQGAVADLMRISERAAEYLGSPAK